MIHQHQHYHATTLYQAISLKHFFLLLGDVLIFKFKKGRSLTVHLPLEIQHPHHFHHLFLAKMFIEFGELLKYIFQIHLYWENAPLLVYGSWQLKFGQTVWRLIPKNIDLCLDVGHLILGCKNIPATRNRILKLVNKRGFQIKHLHLHENDLVHDLHFPPRRILGSEIIQQLTKNRTYIFEK